MDILSSRGPSHRNTSGRTPQEQNQQQQLENNTGKEEKEEEEEGVNSYMQLALVLPSEMCPKKAILPPPPKPHGDILIPSPRWAARVAMGLTAAVVAWTLLSTGEDTPCLNKTWHGRVRIITATEGPVAGRGGGEGASTASRRGRVAVCFFGLGRSLRWTLPSIERRVLGVLREGGFEVDVFAHTYRLLEVSARRNTDNNVGASSQEHLVTSGHTRS